MKTYPAITLVARHGWRVVILIGVIVFLMGLISVWNGSGVLPLMLAAVAGGVAWAIARLLAELVEVIADTLLPR